jgi:hypothetical protein
MKKLQKEHLHAIRQMVDDHWIWVYDGYRFHFMETLLSVTLVRNRYPGGSTVHSIRLTDGNQGFSITDGYWKYLREGYDKFIEHKKFTDTSDGVTKKNT